MQASEIVQSILVSITLIMLLVCLVIYILFNYKKNHNKFIKELETINSNYERELLSTELEIQEQTFQNISQDLHDNIGQLITLANLSISKLMIIENDQVKENALASMDLLEKCLEEVRTLSKSLSTDNIRNIGLVNAISVQLQQLKKLGGFEVNLMLTGKSRSFDEEKELVLFRIFQESLNNIIKHAKAESVLVSLHYGEKNFHLSISDDGMGFLVEEQLRKCKQNSSSGLRNIIRRATLIEATYTIDSSPDGGSQINITTPYI